MVPGTHWTCPVAAKEEFVLNPGDAGMHDAAPPNEYVPDGHPIAWPVLVAPLTGM